MAEVLMGYAILKKLSENDLSISYLAQNKDTGSLYFLKAINPHSTALTLESKNEIFRTSWKLQSALSSSTDIITAETIAEDNQQLGLVYPYLPPERYRPLKSSDLEQKPQLLIKIAYLIDLLHVHGLVHTDVKLSNFFLDTKFDKVLLIDLEFLTQKNRRPRGFIRGTEHHISPKIINNDILDTSVDYFSLGVMLQEVTRQQRDFSSFAEELQSQAPVHPFHLLGDGLAAHNLISKDDYRQYMQRLFGAYSLTSLPAKKYHNTLKKYLSLSKHIIGIHHDVIEFIDEHVTQRKDQHHILKLLITSSKITYYDSLWMIETPHQAILAIIAEILQTSLDENIDLFQTFMDNERYYLAYILGKSLYQSESAPLKNKQSFLEQFMQLAYAHGDYTTCLSFNSASNGNAHQSTIPIERIQIMSQLQISLQESLIDDINNNDILPDPDKTLFSSLVSMRLGKFTKARQLLSQVMETAANDQYFAYKTKYYSVLYHAFQGEFEEALALGVELEQNDNSSSESLSVANLSMLANMAYEMGDYKKVIKYSNKGLSQAGSLATFDKKTPLHLAIANAHLRKSSYQKSLEHLFLSVQSKDLHRNHHAQLLYFLTYANYLVRTGEYLKAKNLLNTISQKFSSVSSRNMGKVYQLLMEVAWFTGRDDLFLYAYEHARNLFTSLKDQTSLTETQSLKLSYELIKSNDEKIEEAIHCINDLFQKKSYYCAYRMVLALCLGSIKNNRFLPEDLALPKHPLIKQSPFMSLCYETYHNLKAYPREENKVSILKSLIPTLRNQKEYYFYALVLECLGGEYHRQQEEALAGKYFQLASETYAKIHNIHQVAALKATVEREAKKSSVSINATILNQITDLLASVDNLAECYHKVLQFAIKCTNAERAVLLVKSVEDKSLKVKAALNCDYESLKEIEDYSSSLTHRSYEENISFIVDNALQDEHLSHYKSVIKHNILSIIAIPLRKGEETLGVLYLDHHIIPALFSREDIIFTKTIANMLSIVIATSSIMQNYKIKNQELLDNIQSVRSQHTFKTQNDALLKLFEQLPRFAQSNTPILLLGESGTGKEILAEKIHLLSKRNDRPLIKINAAAIPEKLIEAELFGIANKVATDVKGRLGKFEAADGGTLFIDEIGDLPLEIQAKILRAIEYQEIERVGYKMPIRTDIRFIYATNKNLEEMIQQKLFREDLYYRISTFPIHIPPLRERSGDIPFLIKYFISGFDQNISISSEVQSLLESYSWPGNVRELKNTLERLALLAPHAHITFEMLPTDLKEKLSKHQTCDPSDIDKIRCESAYRRNKQNQSKAARELGIPLSTYRRKLKLYNIV